LGDFFNLVLFVSSLGYFFHIKGHELRLKKDGLGYNFGDFRWPLGDFFTKAFVKAAPNLS
jgi:hypothetical protein